MISDNLPPPDLRQLAGRARRLVLALLIGIGVSSLAYVVAKTLIAPEPASLHRRMSRDTFVGWVVLVSGLVSFVCAVVVQNGLAKRRSQTERLPRARIH